MKTHDSFGQQHVYRIQFRSISGWPGIDDYWLRFLKAHGKQAIAVDKDPHVTLYSVFGLYRYTKFFTRSKSRHVFFTGENHRPDKSADLNLSFSPTASHNNVRFPFWAMSGIDPKFKMKLVEKTGSAALCIATRLSIVISSVTLFPSIKG